MDFWELNVDYTCFIGGIACETYSLFLRTLVIVANWQWNEQLCLQFQFITRLSDFGDVKRLGICFEKACRGLHAILQHLKIVSYSREADSYDIAIWYALVH